MNQFLAFGAVVGFLIYMAAELGWGGGTHVIENARRPEAWREYW